MLVFPLHFRQGLLGTFHDLPSSRMAPVLFAAASTPGGNCQRLRWGVRHTAQVMWLQETKFALSLYSLLKPLGALWDASQNSCLLCLKRSIVPARIADCFIEEGMKRAIFCFQIGLSHVCPLLAHAGRWEEEQVRTSSSARALSWERGVWGCQLGTVPCGNVVPLAKT